jgi:hypothetical protein
VASASPSHPFISSAPQQQIHAWRSHGRHRARQRSSRVAVLFLLAVASLILPGAAAAINTLRSHGRPLRSPPRQQFSRGFVFFSCFPQKFETDRGEAGSQPVARSKKFQFSPAAISAEPPCISAAFCSKLRAPHRGASLDPFVGGATHTGYLFFSTQVNQRDKCLQHFALHALAQTPDLRPKSRKKKCLKCNVLTLPGLPKHPSHLAADGHYAPRTRDLLHDPTFQRLDAVLCFVIGIVLLRSS